MRPAVAVVMLAGCNQVFGLKATTTASDASAADPCDPLPFDAARYFPLGSGGGVNWSDARRVCQSFGFDLAVIDADDSAEISNELQGGPSPFWFGVSYDGAQWNAIDTCAPLLQWGPGQPGVPIAGDCVLQNQGGMVAFDCSGTMAGPGINALCETPRPSLQCRMFATQRDYVVASTTYVTNDQAEMMCAAMGRHLPVIDSSAEISAIATMFPNVPRFWIGATRSPPTWTSPNGCPPVFHWGANEPIASPADCAVLDSGVMHADYCGNVPDAAVLCELNAAM